MNVLCYNSLATGLLDAIASRAAPLRLCAFAFVLPCYFARAPSFTQVMNTPYPPVPVWADETSFPPKPEGHPYGYLRFRKPIPCSKDDLIQRCASKDVPTVVAVWHPGAARVVPAVQAEFLVETIRQRQREELKSEENNAVAGLVLGIAMIIIGCLRGSWDPQAALLLIFGGVLPYVVCRRRRRQEPTDPSSRDLDLFAAWLSLQRHNVTWLLVGLTLTVAVAQLVGGPETSIVRAGLDKAAVHAGEYWRLVTGPWLHGGLMHLTFNAP